MINPLGSICRRSAILLLSAGSLALIPSGSPAQTRTRHVVLIVADGLRWQEMFHGADPSLIDRKRGGVRDPESLRKLFWRPDGAEARRALLPFFWTVIVRDGQLYGNRTKGSVARVTNELNFSYPGYNEMLTGAPDPRIDRNDFGPNPNVNVLEFLNHQPDLRGRVAAFAAWGVFHDIFHRQRSELPVYAGWEPPVMHDPSPRLALLGELYRTTTRLWNDNLYDSFLQATLKEYLARNRPRVLFVGYGETDEWAHMGRYDLTLNSAHQFDRFVAELWELLQSVPEYRGSTTLLITTDHGRGRRPDDWMHHGRKISGADEIWVAALGPDTPALGEREHLPAVSLSQIASTVTALLGHDWLKERPDAAPPLSDVLGGQSP